LHLAEKRFAKAQQNAQAREDKDRKAKEKNTQEDAEMCGVELESNPEAIRALKGQKLALQIKWHQRNKTMDPQTRKKATAGMSKLFTDEKRERLVELAAFASEGMVVDEPEKSPGSYQVRSFIQLSACSDMIYSYCMLQMCREGPRIGRTSKTKI
jgi:hypothetical protein